jgi:hypothetical protein
MKSRKERRQEARTNGTTFEPQYNGEGVLTKAEYKKKKFSKFIADASTDTLVETDETVETETTKVE